LFHFILIHLVNEDRISENIIIYNNFFLYISKFVLHKIFVKINLKFYELMHLALPFLCYAFFSFVDRILISRVPVAKGCRHVSVCGLQSYSSQPLRDKTHFCKPWSAGVSSVQTHTKTSCAKDTDCCGFVCTAERVITDSIPSFFAVHPSRAHLTEHTSTTALNKNSVPCIP
jgi:hypothetical protein